jgi:hypothetical protein
VEVEQLPSELLEDHLQQQQHEQQSMTAAKYEAGPPFVLAVRSSSSAVSSWNIGTSGLAIWHGCLFSQHSGGGAASV